jgi:hypothetical protein
MSTLKKIFFTSALLVSANAFVLSVSSMVYFYLISGKHKDHDVKTIRKAHPTVKNELEGSLDKIETSI